MFEKIVLGKKLQLPIHHFKIHDLICNDGDTVETFVDWYEDGYLKINVAKTKELISEFRMKGDAPTALEIKRTNKNETVERF